ncbi:hypothetical protein AKO1_014011, partial [Acrasis kona]
MEAIVDGPQIEVASVEQSRTPPPFNLNVGAPEKNLLDFLMSNCTTEPDEKDFDEVHTVICIKGYKDNLVLTVIFYLLCVLSLGSLLLFSRWFPKIWLLLTHLPCPLSSATSVLIKSRVGNHNTICKIQSVDISTIANSSSQFHTQAKIINYRHLNYIFDQQNQQFKPLRFNTSIHYNTLEEMYTRDNISTWNLRSLYRFLYGLNVIDIPIKNYIELLLDEILHPFYIFQVLSVIIWLIDGYYVYALSITIISSLSAFFSLIDTRTNLITLSQTAKYTCDVIRIDVDHEQNKHSTQRIDSTLLVPGDLIDISNPLTLPCDCVVLRGQVIVNESSLTGESVPVTKIPIPNNQSCYDIDHNRNHTLYAGTSVLQTRPTSNQCVAMVMRTGFASEKGKLMLSVLYPKPTSFKFYEDSIRFIIFMFILGSIGIVFSIVQLARLNVPVGDIILRGLDVITIAVPPALPLAMTVGIGFALARLKKNHFIYCISPPRINVCGQIKLMCFDKTGTLTQEGLELHGIKSILDHNQQHVLFTDEVKCNDIQRMTNNNTNEKILNAMATCHSLTHVNGTIVGDPLEEKIFASTQCILKESDNHRLCTLNHSTLEVIRTFEFNSNLQYMSVLVKEIQTNNIDLYIKGSPEKIRNLCIPMSIPNDYHQILNQYTHQGYRVLSMAYKKIDQQQLESLTNRSELENEFIFLGFIIMYNELKKDTIPVIRDLIKNKIKCVMVTGDNALTSTSVAIQCGLLINNNNNNTKIYLSHLKEEQDGEIMWRNIDNDQDLLCPHRFI